MKTYPDPQSPSVPNPSISFDAGNWDDGCLNTELCEVPTIVTSTSKSENDDVVFTTSCRDACNRHATMEGAE